MMYSGTCDTVKNLYHEIEQAFTAQGWIGHVISTNSVDSSNDSIIFEGVGAGTDKIYVGLSLREQENKIILDSCVGYDTDLGFYEQPGCIQQWLKRQKVYSTNVKCPAFSCSDNERFAYWIFIDTYRIIVITRMSINYQSMYAGFINPISSERQYPYPMYVCGNTVFDSTDSWSDSSSMGSFIFPSSGTGYLRRASGEWREFTADSPNPLASTDGTVFPYTAHNTSLLPNYKEIDSINQDNFLLIPIILMGNNPVDVYGILRDVYWVSGTRDIDAERTLSYGSDEFIVFDTKQMRGSNTYFCIKK